MITSGPTRIIGAALAVLMLSLQGALAQTRIALVIGNGAYEEGPLDNPPRDAELMAETLRDLDFAVTFEKNVDQRTMKRLIAAFGDRLRETSDAVAFFYYSGHGMQVKGRNYMIPVDARINDEPDVEIDGVPAWSVLTNMEHSPTAMNIVVLDACRNNPFEKRFKSPQEGIGLAPMQAPAGTLVAYATAPGDVADPGPRGGYSPFTETLANELRTSTASILGLFNSVSSKVYERTGREQRPYLESSVVPPFSFKRPDEPPQFWVAPVDLEMAVTAGSRINVRAGPGTEFARTGRLESNQLVEVTGEVEGREWYRVRLPDGSEGYVFAGLLGEVAREIIPSPVEPVVGVYPEVPPPGSVLRDCPECPEMVLVPAGEFPMGSPKDEPDRDNNEGPQHKVTIAERFWVGKYEVTFAEWDACVAAGGCSFNPNALGWGRDNRPVIHVSWNDAKEYVGWLSQTTGKTYRLLSEAEWEYVARAGSATAYWWGQDVGKGNANCRRCGSEWDDSKTAPVGSFKANDFGLHDTAGNVWEWVEDCWNGSYDGAPTDGSSWLEGDCSSRVLRGGSWEAIPWHMRSAARSNRQIPELRLPDYGFRVARTAD